MTSTRPVLRAWLLVELSFYLTVSSLIYMLPVSGATEHSSSLQEDIPKPDNRHVKLVKTNSSKVYVHEFGGFAISWLVKREIDHLRLDLKDLGASSCFSHS